MKTIKIYRSHNYLKYIRQQKCCVCGRSGDIQAHHSETGGKGIKASDLTCIPLCAVHHHEIHTEGKATFAEKYKITYKMEQIKCLVGYLMCLSGLDLDVNDILLMSLMFYVEALENER